MFATKYTATILNSKWEVIKRRVKFLVLPRKDELVYINDKYFEVLNIVHMLDKTHGVFIIINEFAHQVENKITDNQ